MQKFIKRFKEPSSWAGISALAIVFGVPPGTADLAVQAFAAITALLAVVVPEKAAE